MDYNRFDLEKEQKDNERKEILDSLNNNGNSNKIVYSENQSFGQLKKKSEVNFNRENERYNNETVSELNNDENNGGGKILLLFCVVLAVAAIYLFPIISEKITDYRLNGSKKDTSTTEKKEGTEKVYKKLELNDSEVKNVSYPILHTDNTKKVTYLGKEKVTVKDISNNDLLYNSFVRVSTLIGDYKGAYTANLCTNTRKSIKAAYIEKNISTLFGRTVKYKTQDINVPVNDKLAYNGLWKYDRTSDKYVYYGNCNPSKSNLLYYDISVPYDVDSSEKNIDMYIYSNVAFVEVNKNTNDYVLYSDSNYTNEVSRGKLTTKNMESELKVIIQNQPSKFNKYKYTFSLTNCPYQAYCFVSGEWIK